MNPLTPPQPAEAGFFSPEESSALPPESVEDSPLPLSSDELEKQYRSTMKPKELDAMDRFLAEGAKILFGPDTHYKAMKGIDKSKDVGGDVGRGIAFVVDMLIKQSKGLDQNQDAQAGLMPAGTLLLVDVAEFLQEKGIPFTEKDYEKAMHIFDATIQGKYNPEYKAKMDEYGTGEEPAPAEEPIASRGMGAAPQAPLPRASLGGGGGLLNQGGR